MKKFIYSLLMLMAVSFTVQAQWNQYWHNGIHYEIITENRVKVIAVDDDSYSGNITIPATTQILVGYSNSHSIGEPYQRSFIVAEIDENAFNGCTGLTSISLPYTIKTIGKNAFHGCTGLTSVTLPNGVTTIGASAFAECTNLRSVIMPNSVNSMDWNVFYGCSSLTSVTLSNNLNALNGTFSGCTSLTSIDIPSGVKQLDGTFAGCTGLTTVKLPSALSYIGESTFQGCTSLTGIYLPNSLTYIGKLAFAYTGLTSVELPDAVIYLGENVFYGCTGLASVTIRATNPPMMENVDGFLSETYGMAALTVPKASLTAYLTADWWNLFEHITGNAALNNHYDFEKNGIYYTITGSNTVEVTFKDRNYNSYSGTITVPASVSRNGVTYSVIRVGHSAFRGCTGLTAVNLPASVTAIGKNAFYRSGLTDIAIPEAVTYIGDSAYYSCSGLANLANLTIPKNVTTIGKDAFLGVGMQSLTWNARECWTIGNMTTQNISQVTIGNEVTVLPEKFAHDSQITSVELPNSLTTISDRAFYSTYQLTSLTIPENVTEFAPSAFYNNRITTLTWNARECISGLVAENGYYYYEYWYNWNSTFNQVSNLTIGDQVRILPYGFVAGSNIASVTIPNSVEFIGGGAFCNCTNLTGITIPDAVKEIGVYAFAYDQNMTHAIIGKGVERIGEKAFYSTSLQSLTWNAVRCETMGLFDERHSYDDSYYGSSFNHLTQITIGNEVEKIPNYFAYQIPISSIEIPASVKEIGNLAFSRCAGLTDINLPGSIKTIGSGAFSSCNGLTEVIIPGSVDTIGSDAFSYCDALTYASIPASVKSLQGFNNCYNLTEVSISALNIGSDAFAYCNKLSDLTLSAPLQSIAEGAFNQCNALTSLVIPNTVTTIQGHPFYNCNELESIVVAEDNPVYDSRDNCNAIIKTENDSLVLTCKNSTLPSGLTSIGDYAFYNSEITSMVIPSTVKSIGKYAFASCSKLTSVTIPDGVTTIGDNAFSGCSALSAINLPKALTAINPYTFLNCRKLTSLAIPAATTSINTNAFTGCTAIESITIDEANPVYDSRDNSNAIIETDSNTLLMGCKGTTIPGTVTAIGDYAFNGCYLSSINIPASITSIGSDAFYGCSKLKRVDITDLNAWCQITFSNGYSNPLYFAKHLYKDNTELTEFEIPDGTTEIKDFAFYGWTGLTKVTIPSTVQTINKSAFCYCSNLSNVTIPDAVTTIGQYAFYYCSNLSSVTFGNGTEIIGDYAFNYCSKLSSLQLGNSVNTIGNYAFGNCSSLQSVSIPDAVTTLGQYAFSYCSNLSNLTLGNSVKTIGNYAFYYCNNLPNLVIGDAVETIGEFAFRYCSNLSSVTFGNSVKTIGRYAFYDAKMASIVLPASLSNIEAHAFGDCSQLRDVTCLATTPPTCAVYWTFDNYSNSTLRVPEASIGAYQSAYCWQNFNTIVAVSGTKLGDVDGDGVTNIGDTTTLIDMLLSDGNSDRQVSNEAADIDGDGKLTIKDVTSLVDLLLKSN